MSEIASAFPTAGGPYWWAHKLAGAGWSWITGWFNVLGLVGIVASVDYILAFFLTQLFGLWGWDLGFINFADDQHVIQEIFWLFAILLALHAMINIFSHRLIALFTSISVWWHVAGALIILGILIIVPDLTRARTSSSPVRSTTPGSPTAPPAAGSIGSSSFRWGSC